MFLFFFSLSMIKEFCLSYVVKEDNIHDIVMSAEFVDLCKPLMVELFRKRFNPGRPEMRIDRSMECYTLENDLAAFLKTGGREFCDIQLLLDGQVVRAHKSILAARCTYFQAMFRSFMPPDNRVHVQIGDISPSQKAFQSLLRYIYYGEKKMPAEDSLYLFSAPCFYGTLQVLGRFRLLWETCHLHCVLGFTNTRLQAFCKYNLEHQISSDNVVEILDASDRMKAHDIKQHALRMIVRNFGQVGRQAQIRSLSRELLIEVIVSVSERVSLQPVGSREGYETIRIMDDD